MQLECGTTYERIQQGSPAAASIAAKGKASVSLMYPNRRLDPDVCSKLIFNLRYSRFLKNTKDIAVLHRHCTDVNCLSAMADTANDSKGANGSMANGDAAGATIHSTAQARTISKGEPKVDYSVKLQSSALAP